MKKLRFLFGTLALVCLAPAAATATAPGGQGAFPTQTVRIVVPYAPGGGLDVLARGLADRLQQKWGKPVIVDNKTGASTIIGASAVTKAQPDGHTLLLTSEATITSNPFLFEKLPYDPVKDLTPIARLASLPQMVIAHPAVSAGSVQDLIAQAKSARSTNGLSYASYGSGSLPHLLFEGLRQKTGAPFVHVPYKGIAPAVLAVLSGEVDLSLAGVPSAQVHIAAGKLKPIAVAGSHRLSGLPQVPTLQEAGFGDIDPGESWFGLFVTAGTPAGVTQQIRTAVAEVMADAGFRERFITSRGYEPATAGTEAFAEFIQDDMRRKARLIRISGAKAE